VTFGVKEIPFFDLGVGKFRHEFRCWNICSDPWFYVFGSVVAVGSA